MRRRSYNSVTITTDVEVNMDEFETEDLIEELESRGHTVVTDDQTFSGDAMYDISTLADAVYWRIRDGEFDSKELREMVSRITGRIL